MQRIALALLAHIEESTVGVDLEGECLLFTADMSSESCSQFDSLPRIYLTTTRRVVEHRAGGGPAAPGAEPTELESRRRGAPPRGGDCRRGGALAQCMEAAALRALSYRAERTPRAAVASCRRRCGTCTECSRSDARRSDERFHAVHAVLEAAHAALRAHQRRVRRDPHLRRW